MSVGLIGHTLTAPVLGPIRGLLWLARTIEERAKAELYDEDKIRGAHRLRGPRGGVAAAVEGHPGDEG